MNQPLVVFIGLIAGTAICQAARHPRHSEAETSPPAKDWASLCSVCHGAGGTANTRVAQKLKVPDFSDPKSLAGKSDADLQAAIMDGVKRDGQEVMKPYKEILSADDARAFVARIRTFGKK